MLRFKYWPTLICDTYLSSLSHMVEHIMQLMQMFTNIIEYFDG